MSVGERAKLKVTCNPTNTTDSKDVEWESADEDIVKVENGTVIAVSEGQAEITASVGKEHIKEQPLSAA